MTSKSTNSDVAGPSLLKYVPADTVAYFGGEVSPEISKMTDDMPLNLGVNLAEARKLLSDELITEDDNEPLFPFVEALIADLQTNVVVASDVDSHLGIKRTAPSVAYMHGIYPVVRGYLADTEVFEAFWSNIAKKANVDLETQKLGDVTYWTIPLITENSGESQHPAYDLAIKHTDNQFTLAVISSADTQEALQERLAIVAPKDSLEATDTLDGVKKSVGMDNVSQYGFIDFTRIASAVMHSEDSRLARDIATVQKATNTPAADFTPACQKELGNLVAMVPRVVVGSRGEKTGDNEVSVTMQSRLEVDSKLLSDSFKSISGYLPDYGQGKDALLDVKLGLNIGQLAPVLTNLWQKATATPAQCQLLAAQQMQLQQTNPAMLGIVTSMLQGVKGVGVALYDVDVNGPVPSADMLLSLSGDNPTVLVNLANQFVLPRLGGYDFQPLKSDGSETTLDLSRLVPDLSVKLAVKGKNLVAYTGEKSKAAAEALTQEKLDANDNLPVNGLLAAGANYPRLAEVVESLPPSLVGAMQKDDPCMWQATTALKLRAAATYSSGDIVADDNGLLQHNVTMVKLGNNTADSAVGDVAGKYDLSDLNENCRMPVIMGTEEFKADGTGHYSMTDGSGSCALREASYHWVRKGDHLVFSFDKKQVRDDCGSEWTVKDPGEQATCDLIKSENGFNCLYADEGGTALIGYRPQQESAQ